MTWLWTRDLVVDNAKVLGEQRGDHSSGQQELAGRRQRGEGGGGECAAGRGKHFPNVHGRVEQGMSLEHSLKWLFFKLKKNFFELQLLPLLFDLLLPGEPHLPSPSLLISCTHGGHGGHTEQEVSRDPFCFETHR